MLVTKPAIFVLARLRRLRGDLQGREQLHTPLMSGTGGFVVTDRMLEMFNDRRHG